jgi:tetratricopeptide (TPR) repeat protein
MSPTIVCVVSVLFTASALVAQNVPVQDRAANGISFARQGKLTEAERELRAAIIEAPSVAVYRAQLASILGLQGKWGEALEYFQKAVQLAPENLDFRRETAAVQWQLNLMPAAESNLQYVLEKRPGDPGALMLLGLVKEKTGDYAEAAQLLDSQFELVAAQPERTVALFHSVIESGLGDKIAKLVKVLKLHANDKSWAGTVSRCTEIAMSGGDLQTSEALFSLIPLDNPVWAEAGFQLAKSLYNHSQPGRAKDLLLQLKSQGIENGDVENLLGNCLESERQPEQAIAAYRRAIAADPSRIDLYEDLISLLLYQHRTADALLVAKQALTVAPNDSRPWVWKGNVDLSRNDYRGAQESYTHAVGLDSGNPDALFGVAGLYYVTGQGEAAISECKAGISRFPGDARFYISYAEMLLASPDAFRLHAQAKDLLERALKLAPQSAQAHYLLGQIALQEGELKEAEEDLLRSLASDPDRSKTHFALSRVYRRTERADQAAKEFALYEKLKEREESGSTTALVMPERQ